MLASVANVMNVWSHVVPHIVVAKRNILRIPWTAPPQGRESELPAWCVSGCCSEAVVPLLLPAAAVCTEIDRRRTSIGWSELFNLKRVFGVSVQAIVYRCRDLRIINDALYTRLFRDISRFGWRTSPYPEPQPIEPEWPSRFERLCSRALAENVISEAKAAELLGKSVRDLHQWMEQPPQD